MSDFILSCCSCVDLPASYLEERQIPAACYTYTIEDVPYTDDFGATISIEEFYKKIDNGAMPTTSQINLIEFIEYFEPFVKEGHDILHLAFSSGLSGTANNAIMAANELMEKYPDRKIYVVDSLCASSGYGLFVDVVYNKIQSGASLEEAYQFAEDIKLNINHWFYTTDLTHLKRGGRVSPAACAIGNLINLCPFLQVDHEGHLTVKSKIRGKKKAAKEALNTMIERCDNGLDYDQQVFVSNSGCPEDAEYLISLIKETFPKVKKIELYDIGVIVGSHTGRGTVALFFLGKARNQ